MSEQQLREDIAGAIYDATGLHGAVWAEVCDVASEHALADHVMAVIAPIMEQRDQALAAASDAEDRAFAAREDLALGDIRLAERTAQRDRMRLAWMSARRGRYWARFHHKREFEAHVRGVQFERDRTRAIVGNLQAKFNTYAEKWRRGRDEDRAELAALHASAVVLPETWLGNLWNVLARTIGDLDSLNAAYEEVGALIQSWRPVTVEATPPTLAETRTGMDWCPNCRTEAGTNRCRDNGGTERCATCWSELVELPTSQAVGGINYGSHVGEVDAPPDPTCSCDATGAPEFPHRDYCELNHPHHPCDPRLCRFADATDATGTEATDVQ